MKKITTTLLITTLLNVASAFAQGGTTGPLTWDFNPDTGTLTISGNGVMPDYEWKADSEEYTSPWYYYRLSIKTIVIGTGVTTIGDYAFCGCENLISITLPTNSMNLKNIRNYAFYGCKKIASIEIPNSITTIGDYAFAECANLTTITILSLTPIDINSTVFDGVYQNACVLKVATSAVSVFQNADIWKEFNIVGGGVLIIRVSNNSEQGYTNGSGLVPIGVFCKALAFAYNGFKFHYWLIDGIVGYGTPNWDGNEFSFTSDKDMEIVANFTEDVGIETVECENTMVYPNPFNNHITVFSNDEKHITITDIVGKVLYDSQLSDGINEISTTHFHSGIFFVRVQNNDNSIKNFKILKSQEQ